MRSTVVARQPESGLALVCKLARRVLGCSMGSQCWKEDGEIDRVLGYTFVLVSFAYVIVCVEEGGVKSDVG